MKYLLSFLILLLVIGCVKQAPLGAKDRSCNEDSDCVIDATLDPKNNCCYLCDVESISVKAKNLRDEWQSENCKGMDEEGCIIYDCYIEKQPNPVCKNKICDIKWIERQDDVPEGDISSDDCLSQGGEIVDVDPDNTSCPGDQIKLGMVWDVNCICACCK